MMDFGTIGGIVTSVVFGGGAALGLVRLNMRGAFVSLAAHHRLEERMADVEQRLSQLPTQQDLNAVGARMGAVEKAVGVVDAKLDGMAAGVRRAEHMLDLLLDSALKGEAQSR